MFPGGIPISAAYGVPGVRPGMPGMPAPGPALSGVQMAGMPMGMALGGASQAMSPHAAR